MPVNTVSRRFGISMLTSLRLFTRAPCTRMRSWLSAARSAPGCVSALSAMLIVLSICWTAAVAGRLVDRGRSGQLLDADHVARGIAERAVANAVRLVGRLLDDLGLGRLQPRERAVEVAGGEVDAGVRALGHHLGDGAALVFGDAGGGGRRIQDDRRAGLVGGTDRDPAHAAVVDLVADLEAEGVAIEGHRRVRIVVWEEGREDRDVHGGHASCGSVAGASRFLIGLVTCFATHGGMPAVARPASRR